MSAHTPGPWKVEDDGREVVVYAVEGSCRVASIELDNLDDRSHALRDARLIAAAPELLAALKDAEALLNHGDFSNGNMHPDWYGPDEGSVLAGLLVGRIRAAIAKAEGKS